MFYDTLTTAAICDELKQKIEGGSVQKVLHLSEHSIGMEIYAHQARKWLLISAHPQQARVNLVPEKLARGSDEVSPLLLLLRKYVRDSRLTEISQPPMERLLMLTFEKRDMWDESTRIRVIIEIMGRHSNVSMIDGEGLIMDSLRRVPPGLNRHRVVLPKHPYVFPPSQNKVPPERVTANELRATAAAAGADKPLWLVLVAVVAGMSPLLAREIVHRATGDAQAPADGTLEHADAVIEEVAMLYGPLRDHRWAPSVARERGAVVAFAPYQISHMGDVAPAAGISAAVEAYFGEQRYTSGEQAKVQVRRQLGDLRERHLRRKESLERSLERGAEAERLRRSGEAILASVRTLAAGARQLDFDGETIELDGRLSAPENAREYFRAYKKAKAALAQVPELLVGEEAALAYLDDVSTLLELAESAEDVRRVGRDMAQLGQRKQQANTGKLGSGKKARKTGRTPPAPIRPETVAGFDIYVGHSALQNDEITFRVAGPDDLWLHARQVPGAHVVVKSGGRKVPETVVRRAAASAATYSQARGSNRVAVDCTARKLVKRVPQGLPGLVTYSGERTIYVEPS